MNSRNIIKNLYETFGSSDYIGEPITQLEHALQASIQAINDKMPPSMILSAFLHDIGHLVGLQQNTESQMSNDISLGIKNHEELGANFLKDLQFPDAITIPIRNHVIAKRYLLTMDESYRYQVSTASMLTFEIQGGYLSADECANFENSPYFDESIQLRIYDDNSKVANMPKNNEKQQYLDYIMSLI